MVFSGQARATALMPCSPPATISLSSCAGWRDFYALCFRRSRQPECPLRPKKQTASQSYFTAEFLASE
jgi:hypothetical protein